MFFEYDGGQHGLIAARQDQSTGIRWGGVVNNLGAIVYTNTHARADGIGAGLKNTAIIIASQSPVDGNAFAATLCNEYSVTVDDVTYGDWYLPSKYELDKMYLNRVTINTTALLNGGSEFYTNLYWSSTEIPENKAPAVRFSYDIYYSYEADKASLIGVRAVRAF